MIIAASQLHLMSFIIIISRNVPGAPDELRNDPKNDYSNVAGASDELRRRQLRLEAMFRWRGGARVARPRRGVVGISSIVPPGRCVRHASVTLLSAACRSASASVVTQPNKHVSNGGVTTHAADNHPEINISVQQRPEPSPRVVYYIIIRIFYFTCTTHLRVYMRV